MADLRTDSDACRRLWDGFRRLLVLVAAMAVAVAAVGQQIPSGPPAAMPPVANPAMPSGGPLIVPPGVNQPGPPPAASLATASPTGMVVDVQVQGNKSLPLSKILPHIRTRAGRPFDRELIEEDVRRLDHTHMFVNVRTWYQQLAGGYRVIFELLERPLLREVLFIGCGDGIRKQTLQKEADIKVGDPADPFAIEEARRKLEEFYRSKGFTGASVTLREGNKPEDRKAIFVINEGVKQKVWDTKFIGNTIATDDRLRTQISSKHPFLYLFGGEFDRKKLDDDVKMLTAYYRGLGFFQARIGTPLLEYNEKENWVTVTFVIDEGPRFKIRTISVIGNTKYTSDELMSELKLKNNEYFNQAKMTVDQSTLQDKYGGIGYVFAKIDADPRFLAETGQLDLVYNIKEGDRFRVGKINVQIKGDYPHTLITTVLNRLSFKPGDVVDIREIRASERRLKASQLFEANPAGGKAPKIAFSPPGQENEDSDDDDKPDNPDKPKAGRKRGGFRSQSPDPAPRDRNLDLTLDCGQYVGSPPSGVDPPAPPNGGRGEGNMAGGPRPAAGVAGNNDLTQLVGEFSTTLTQSRTTPQSPARLIPTQLYVPDTGQVAPAPQHSWPPSSSGSAGAAAPDNPPPTANYAAPAATAPSPAYSSPYAAQTPAAVPQGQASTQAAPAQPAATQPAPVQPAPPYGQQMWSRQGPDQPVNSPQGQYLPGPIFSESSPFRGGPPEGGLFAQPLPFGVTTQETMTGRLMLGIGINSEAGLVGTATLDEQNFDWARFPDSWEAIRNGTAWRGGGQQFRIEAAPGIATTTGTQPAQRYSISFQEPYAFDTQVSLGLSGFYYNRIYTEYTDQRLGGRIALGYQFAPDFSAVVAYRGADVRISNPIDPAVPALAEVVGRNLALHGFQLTLTENKRDSNFMPTEGYFIEASFEQVLGSFQYPHAELDLRKYFTLFQRPDCSGRHVLSLASRVGVTGDDTPIYERYYAGGFNTIRGFQFRGASPSVLGPTTGDTVMVGGDFELLGSVEYNFPITADDMLRAVVFCDSGTVEPTITNWTDKYRIAPGFGLRICVPAMGPAPIALDFAFPISWQHGDRQEMFSFFMGINR